MSVAAIISGLKIFSNLFLDLTARNHVRSGINIKYNNKYKYKYKYKYAWPSMVNATY
jgi:hypothetical protein